MLIFTSVRLAADVAPIAAQRTSTAFPMRRAPHRPSPGSATRALELPDELVYVPPPDAYPTPKLAAFATEPTAMPQETSQLDEEAVGELMSPPNEDLAELPQEDATERHGTGLEATAEDEPVLTHVEHASTTRPAPVLARSLLAWLQLVARVWQHEYQNILLGILVALLLVVL